MNEQLEQKYMLDTSALLVNPEIIFDMEHVIVPLVAIEELDNLKTEIGERGAKAREAIRALRDAEHVKFAHDGDWGMLLNDDIIIKLALENHCILVTGDYGMQLKAEARGLIAIDTPQSEEDHYSGWQLETLDDEELADFYGNKNENRFELVVGQYVIIYDMMDNPIDAYRWNGETHEQVRKDVAFKSDSLDKLVPKDFYQMCAMDSLMRNQMTMIKGKAGSGKSLLSLSYVMQMLEKSGKNGYSKLICFVNPVETRSAAKLGAYPGSKDQKLLDGSIGAMLSAKFGGRLAVERLIEDGKLSLHPFSDIRGLDTTGMNAVVYIIEAQNLNKDLMKLAIQRCSDDTKLIIDGDFNQQVDRAEYEGRNNGMRRTSEVFRGESYYGEIELPNVYRSRMAARAERM